MPIKKNKKKNKKVAAQRKQRVQEHIIADLSANFVERLALKNGFSVECITKDYGYDLIVYTFDSNGEFEIGNIFVQLKATDNPNYLIGNKYVSFSTNKKDLRTWYNEPYPVIFILYDAQKEVAYWIYIQQHLRNLANFDLNTIKDNYTIRIPTANLISVNSFQQFRSYKLNTLKQITGVITYQ